MKIADWTLARFRNLLVAYVVVLGLMFGISYVLYHLGENSINALTPVLVVLAYLGTGLAIGAAIAVTLRLIMKIGSLSLFCLSWLGLIVVVPYGVWASHSTLAEVVGPVRTFSESEQIQNCPKNTYSYYFVFQDDDSDGWGECQKREWNRYSRYVSRTPSSPDVTWGAPNDSSDYDEYDDSYYDDSYYDDSYYDDYYDIEPPCIGDCNDMDGDGRTYDDVDRDGDGLYETPRGG